MSDNNPTATKAPAHSEYPGGTVGKGVPAFNRANTDYIERSNARSALTVTQASRMTIAQLRVIYTNALDANGKRSLWGLGAMTKDELIAGLREEGAL